MRPIPRPRAFRTLLLGYRRLAMVRAFARKSERQGKDLSGKNEPGWLDNSNPKEVSPDSLWGLDDEHGLRSREAELVASEPETQSTPVNAAGLEEELPAEAWDHEPVPPYRDESDWWAQPNLMEEELPTTSPAVVQAEAPLPAVAA